MGSPPPSTAPACDGNAGRQVETVKRSRKGLVGGGIGLILCMAVHGCGYRFLTAAGDKGGHATPLFVAALTNRTGEPALESTLTSDLILELTQGGDYVLVAERQAHATVSGAIVAVTDETVSRRAGGQSEWRKAAIVVRLRLQSKDGTVLWSEDRITDHATYGVIQDNRQATDAQRRRALSDISRRVARKVRDSLAAHSILP